MLGAIIGGLASVAGALIGGSKKQKTISKSKVNYKLLVKKAEKAGFNPLTVLRNGGSAAFANTTTVAHPGLSAVGEAVSAMGQSFGIALERKMDPLQQKRDAAESALLDYQLRAIQSQQMPVPRFGDVPQVNAPSVQAVTPGLAKAAEKAPSALAVNAANTAILTPSNYEFTLRNSNLEVKKPQITPLGMNNSRYGWFENGLMADYQTVEDANGELVAWPYGLAKTLAADLPYSIYRNMDAGSTDLANWMLSNPSHPVTSALASPISLMRAKADKAAPYPRRWVDPVPPVYGTYRQPEFNRDRQN